MPPSNILDAIIAQSKLSKKETAKQQKIVEAAIALFAERGYANTSTSEIAKKSGVAEGTLFRHYGTKENLLLSVIVPFLKESIPFLAKEVFTDVNPRNYKSFELFIGALLRNRIAFLNENQDIFRVVLKELLYRDELRNELFPHLQSQLFFFLNDALEWFKELGQLKDLPNPVLLRLIMTSVASYLAVRYVLSPNREADDDAEVKTMVDFITGGVGKD
ncbi:TetR/AcrR family transcriptional regulator [Cohnella endophytica]|uniref:TetR/AcrR family transcriptional regulator n=1 Tax=Cohnella endophytica TaxID=2419778 RepID=A0A494Y8Y2_9BACL|nr:TetR/AcrR family transcriptional regulator [Cohnella endophytica]RKP58068.1 TetR/AcrR family transcriptional regulator [Cohnella endophytica]